MLWLADHCVVVLRCELTERQNTTGASSGVKLSPQHRPTCGCAIIPNQGELTAGCWARHASQISITMQDVQRKRGAAVLETKGINCRFISFYDLPTSFLWNNTSD